MTWVRESNVRSRKAKSNQRLVIRVDLVGAQTPIWRRLEIAPELYLDQVHDVLQAAFGWEDAHLHEFELQIPIDRSDKKNSNAEPDPPPGSFAAFRAASGYSTPRRTHTSRKFGMRMEAEENWGLEAIGEPETETTLGELLSKKGDTLSYLYDFGDSWEHSLVVEKVIDVKADAPLARCVDGQRAAPPDDTGGIFNYEWMLDAGTNPDDPDYQEASERMEWLEDISGVDAWDPNAFDLKEVDEAVQAAI